MNGRQFRKCQWCQKPNPDGFYRDRMHPECVAEMDRRRATEPPPPAGMSVYLRWLASHGVHLDKVS